MYFLIPLKERAAHLYKVYGINAASSYFSPSRVSSMIALSL